MHIRFNNLGLSNNSKVLFNNFTTQVNEGDRIAIIGCNGSGKTSLLNSIIGKLSPSEGSIDISNDVVIGYVSQLDTHNVKLSGGQRFNKRLSKALSKYPDILILDEPTNNLDEDNRKSLIKMLKYFYGTLIIVSHDIELIDKVTHTIWDIASEEIAVFNGRYSDYQQEKRYKSHRITSEINQLEKEKKLVHQKRMKEQKRASNSKARGQKQIDNRKWPTVVSKAAMNRSNTTANQKKAAITQSQTALRDKLKNIHFIEDIHPHFDINQYDQVKGYILSISDGYLKYKDEQASILENINFRIMSGERVVLKGKNGAGKSSFIKALLGENNIDIQGSWRLIGANDIGYLDQHYENLNDKLSVFDSVKEIKPEWSVQEVRHKLNEFLFKNNEEVFKTVNHLSGGEKARLSLCIISMLNPKLLILDEVTNNLDIETKEHVSSILASYPGTLLIISHDEMFISKVRCQRLIEIQNKQFIELNNKDVYISGDEF